MIPTIGRSVHYTLRASDAEAINRRRADALRRMDAHRTAKTGVQIHVGNKVHEGDVFPMTIVRVWGETETALVNGQVFLDGNDVFWATSVGVGEGPGTFAWPKFVAPTPAPSAPAATDTPAAKPEAEATPAVDAAADVAAETKEG